jgi:hypothetical protein
LQHAGWLGSAEWQAAPVEAATVGVADSTSWPLTLSMLTLTQAAFLATAEDHRLQREAVADI